MYLACYFFNEIYTKIKCYGHCYIFSTVLLIFFFLFILDVYCFFGSPVCFVLFVFLKR